MFLWVLTLSCSVLFRGWLVVCEVRLFSQLIVTAHTLYSPNRPFWMSPDGKAWQTSWNIFGRIKLFIQLHALLCPRGLFSITTYFSNILFCYKKVIFFSLLRSMSFMCRLYYFSLVQDLDFQFLTLKICYKDMNCCQFKTIILDIVVMTLQWNWFPENVCISIVIGQIKGALEPYFTRCNRCP